MFTGANGQGIRRLRRVPIISAENTRLFLDAVELDADVGVGLAFGQGSDPQVMLRVSSNGGKTWGNERTRGLGAIGAYDTRTRWDRCGAGRKLVLELSMTDPVAARWYGLTAEVS